MDNLKVLENNLVPVYETSTGERVVYGSELHAVLEVKSPYRIWAERRISDIEAIENEDYTSVQICTVSGGTPRKDHIIKLDTAKEMAMLERNEKGKQVRRYFIEVEKKYKEVREAFSDMGDIYKQDAEFTTPLGACLEAAKIMASVPDSQKYVVNILKHCFPDIDAGMPRVQPDNVSVDVPDTEKPVNVTECGGDYAFPFNHNMLDNYLVEHGISRNSLEHMIKCSDGQVTRWCNGFSRPTRSYRIKICEALGLPIGYFDNTRRCRRIQK